MRTPIHVWHLEYAGNEFAGDPVEVSETEATEDAAIARGYRLERLADPTPEFARYLYVAVGSPWLWYMRLGWPWQQWSDRLAQRNVELHVATVNGAPVGYFELEHHPSTGTEICYFGLIPEAIGQGHGRPLLEDAIRTARGPHGRRVWLHTCSLDHPAALPNYIARGFRVFREEDIEDELPESPLQPWPGANRPAD